MKTTMKTNRSSLLGQHFWPDTAVIWGLATGNMITLTLFVALTAWLTGSELATISVGALLLVLMVPCTIYVINVGGVAKDIKSPALVIAGFVAMTAVGFIMPFLLGYGFWKVIRQHNESRPQARKRTGKEIFFSLPEAVARRTGSELSASFFHESDSISN